MLIFIAGMGGTGKDYLGGKLLKYLEDEHYEGIKKLVTYTTREKRDNEVEGVDYHFISEEDFVQYSYNNKWMESRVYNFVNNDNEDVTVRYATPRYEDVNNIYILWGSIDQSVKIKKTNEDETVVIYLNSSAKDRIERMVARAENDNKVTEACRRLYQDHLDYKKVRDEFFPDYIVENPGTSNQAFENLVSIVESKIIEEE